MKLKSSRRRANQRRSGKSNLVDIDPREYPVEDNLTPIENLKTVQIGAQSSQTTQIGSSLSLDEEADIIRILRENVDLFALKPTVMPGIDPNIVCHHIALDSGIKLVAQRKRKEGEEKRKVIDDEVGKLMKADFIKEISSRLS